MNILLKLTRLQPRGYLGGYHGDIYCQLVGAPYTALFCWYRFHASVRYIWDQGLMLGSFDKMIPNFAITIMLLLRDQLLASPTTQQLERTIAAHSSTITERKIQALAETTFMNNLRTKLGIKRDFAGDLYEAVDYERNEFTQNVPGLDQSMDWESFAITSPKRRGRNTVIGSPSNRQSQDTIRLQQQFMNAGQIKNDYASKTYKPDDVLTTKKRFDDHVNQRAAKREEKERKKLEKKRRLAVEEARRAYDCRGRARSRTTQHKYCEEERAACSKRAFEARRRQHEHDQAGSHGDKAHDEWQRLADEEKHESKYNPR